MTPVPRGVRTWGASALCALAVCASLLTLTGPVLPGRWLVVSTLAVVALAALLAAVRSVTTTWWAPTAVGTVVVTLGILAVYASPPGRFQLVPGGSSLGRLGDAFRAGLEYADVSRPPVDATRPLELLLVGGALLVLLVTDLIALGLAAPALAGLPLIALWLPGITLGRVGSGWAFVGTGGAYLLLLALTAAPPPGSRGARTRTDATRRMSFAVAGAASVTVAAVVLGPVAAGLPFYASIGLPTFGSPSSGSLQLAQDLDLRDSLGARSNEVVLTYRTDPVPVGPLRLFTLRDFDGENWARDTRSQNLESDPDVLWPARDLADRPAGETAPTTSEITVTVRGLREDRLPVPVMPRTIDVAGRWSYDAERDEVNRLGATRPGLLYSMQVDLLNLTAANLRAEDADYPPDMDQYLTVPQTAHTADVAAAAIEITSAVTGNYEQALALQSYLRSAQNFTYDTDVSPARSDDAVWDFLESRTGYCVQFGTAMTVLARTLGIPARLGVGFLPGTVDQSGSYVVTGRDSHAWPELYFPGAGWVRFEPTPAVQAGSPPRWADPFSQPGAAPVPEPNPRGEDVAPGAIPSQAPLPGAVDSATRTSTARWIALAGGVSVILLTAGWFVYRRRTDTSEAPDPEVAWARLRTRLGSAGIAWSDARTPRQVEELVAASLDQRNGAPMTEEAATALRELVLAVQHSRYAPTVREWPQGELDRDVDAVLKETTTQVRVRAPLP